MKWSRIKREDKAIVGGNGGFSLMELIIAIAILAILTGLLAPQFLKYIEKSREVRDIQAMDAVYASVQAAFTDDEVYEELSERTESGDYRETLENILKEDSAFGYEIKSLLGETSGELISRKAENGGEICVMIRYREGAVSSFRSGAQIGEPSGFEVMVYCGDSSKRPVGDLDFIGADLLGEAGR